MIEVEINNEKIKVEEGASIIEAADELNIYIPRFCYHKKLSIAANCRMCLVEVEKVGKPLPACATPVTPGMRVRTDSQKTLAAQRAVMEFLLINHPLDCPICDQGGVCELQDLAMGFGRADSRYTQTKRAVFNPNIGPLVQTQMTRCIQCTRCVRFGEEIAGIRELGVVNRGEQEKITTYVKHVMRSELSGNIIDICPVGALTNKPARYQGRGWEYTEHPAISPHDCVGSHLFLHTRGDGYSNQRRVMNVVPREKNQINETWISDRDRYSHFGLSDQSRIYAPRLKKRGKWEAVSWSLALETFVSKVKGQIENHKSAKAIGALASPNLTLEEFYLMQKLVRGLGSDNIDHRLHWQDCRDQHHMPLQPSLNMPLFDLQNQEVILLVGSCVRNEQPLLSHHIYQAYSNGAKIIAINSMDYDFPFSLVEKVIVSPGYLVPALSHLANALGIELPVNQHMLHANFFGKETIARIASLLKESEKVVCLMGEDTLRHAQGSWIRAFVSQIAVKVSAKLGLLTPGANTAGGWLAGALPHRGPGGLAIEKPGLDVYGMLHTHPLPCYFLFNTELELDCLYAANAKRALNNAELVISFTPFVSEAMEDYADMILPIAPFSEQSGTFVNIEGRFQSFEAAIKCTNVVKPLVHILKTLGHLLKLDGFDYSSTSAVYDEVKSKIDHTQFNVTPSLSFPDAELFDSETDSILLNETQTSKDSQSTLIRLAPWPIYSVDNLTRRSKPLKHAMHPEFNQIAVNSKTAVRLNMVAGDRVAATQGSTSLVMSLRVDDRLADNTVFLPSGIKQTMGFGQAESTITLKKGH